MKAARIHAYGDASQIRIEEAPLPQIGPDDLLIRTVAASVNPVDWKIRRGYLAQMIPVVGAPIGAFVNWRLLERLGDTAVYGNRMRELAR